MEHFWATNRVLPKYTDGALEGLSLSSGGRPDSLAAILGLRAEHVVLSVNGVRIDSQKASAQALRILATAPAVDLEVLRRDGIVIPVRANLCALASPPQPDEAREEEMPPPLRSHFHVASLEDERGFGVRVENLEGRDDLVAGGLRVGDVIREIGGSPLAADDPPRRLFEYLQGDRIELLVTDRDGQDKLLVIGPR